MFFGWRPKIEDERAERIKLNQQNITLKTAEIAKKTEEIAKLQTRCPTTLNAKREIATQIAIKTKELAELQASRATIENRLKDLQKSSDARNAVEDFRFQLREDRRLAASIRPQEIGVLSAQRSEALHQISVATSLIHDSFAESNEATQLDEFEQEELEDQIQDEYVLTSNIRTIPSALPAQDLRYVVEQQHPIATSFSTTIPVQDLRHVVEHQQPTLEAPIATHFPTTFSPTDSFDPDDIFLRFKKLTE